MLSLKLYGEAVEFAQTALDISITLGTKNLQHKDFVVFYVICILLFFFIETVTDDRYNGVG